jgi:hypothetical protein
MHESQFIHDSIANMPEDELVERLLSDPLWSSDFFQFAGMPEKMVNRQRVLLDTIPGNYEGDIDILRCNPDHPERAVAYQVKRIKFGLSQVRHGVPSKLNEFRKVARQANLLARIGFWQVYVYVLVVADTREQNFGKVTYAGIPAKLKSLVDSAISLDLLDRKVGLGILDFTQPMDYGPLTVGTHGLHVQRFAIPSVQSQELTDWIAELLPSSRKN